MGRRGDTRRYHPAPHQLYCNKVQAPLFLFIHLPYDPRTLFHESFVTARCHRERSLNGYELIVEARCMKVKIQGGGVQYECPRCEYRAGPRYDVMRLGDKGHLRHQMAT